MRNKITTCSNVLYRFSVKEKRESVCLCVIQSYSGNKQKVSSATQRVMSMYYLVFYDRVIR